MDFRRIHDLPPYVFAQVDQAKIAARRAGEDVVDLGFGNPDIPSPPFVVEKLVEAARKGKNHRYSSSRGLPNLRQAITDLYHRRFGVQLDPETQAVATIGAKEGLSHLMWTLVDSGDTTVVPEPSYPIHIYAPVLAGSDVVRLPVDSESEYFERLGDLFRSSWPKPKVIIVSFPHNPTTTCVDLAFFERLVAFAHHHGDVPGSRLRIRRSPFRRLSASLASAGGRRRGGGRGVVQHDQGAFHAGLEDGIRGG